MADYTPIFDILQTAVIVTAKMSAPVLLLSMGIGILIAIFQAATSIQEQTLTFVPKLFVIGIILILSGGWMLTMLKDLTNAIFKIMLEL